MRRKKKKEGSCYIVRCQGDAHYLLTSPGNRNQRVCEKCKNYMMVKLGWQLAEDQS